MDPGRDSGAETLSDYKGPTVTSVDFVSGLRDMGLRNGDVLLVHSSLSAFGYVEGGPDTVIDALLEVVGKAGTLIMPSFTDVNKVDVTGYDPLTTPVRRNIGKIPDTFWRRPDVKRSRHPPRFPWAAQGTKADELVAIDESRQFGAHHVDGLASAVAGLDGYIMMLGCKIDSNTSIHAAEAAAVSEVEGERMERAEFIPDKPPPGWLEMDEHLNQASVMKMGKIGNAEVRLMRSRDLFRVVKQVYLTKYRGTDWASVRSSAVYVPLPGFPTAIGYQGVAKAVRAMEEAYRSILGSHLFGMSATEIGGLMAEKMEPAGAMPVSTKGAISSGDGDGDIETRHGSKLLTLNKRIRLGDYWAEIGCHVVDGTPSEALVHEYEEGQSQLGEIAAAIKPKVGMDEILQSVPNEMSFQVHRIGPGPHLLPVCGNSTPGVSEKTRETIGLGLCFEPGHVLNVRLSSGPIPGLGNMFVLGERGVTPSSAFPQAMHSVR